MDEENQPFLKKQFDDPNIPPLTKWRNYLHFFWITIDKPTPIRLRYSVFEIWPILTEIFIYLHVIITYQMHIRFHIAGFQGTPLFAFLYGCFSITGLICLLITYQTDPGYLPFYYSQDKKKHYTLDEIKSGTAITQEQIDYAKKQPRPARCSFISSQGRYVLRADHYCSYVGNFIGIYNHRFFQLTMFYMGFSVLYFFILICYEKFIGTYPFSIFVFIFQFVNSFLFSYLLLNNLRFQLTLVSKNITYVESLKGKKHSEYDNGCLRNFEEVCAPRKYLPLWILPIPLPHTVDGFSFRPNEGVEESDSDDRMDENELLNKFLFNDINNRTIL